MKAFIHRFLANPMSRPEIEARSFAALMRSALTGPIRGINGRSYAG